MIRRFLPFLGLLLGLVPLLGCATLIKGSEQKIGFQSAPSGAKVSVFDAGGILVADGTTPITIPLKKGASCFQAAKYLVVFEAPGRQKKEIWISGSLESGISKTDGGLRVVLDEQVSPQLLALATPVLASN
jgi:hypothetical protein